MFYLRQILAAMDGVCNGKGGTKKIHLTGLLYEAI
jgi:hypothetical protein